MRCTMQSAPDPAGRECCSQGLMVRGKVTKPWESGNLDTGPISETLSWCDLDQVT